EGYWHLVKVDTVETGGSRDLSEQLLFWSFQVNLLEMNDRNGNHQAVLLRFDKNESVLRVYEPHLHIPSDGDPLTDDLSYLTPFGMSDTEDTFTIEQKSGSKMILYNGILRLYFKRM
ncbi:MAG: lipocalin-like domain-containing protein, partial [Prevotella sp.]|nr:lipocalin-like domain-containing protein [Prevotella sp.]